MQLNPIGTLAELYWHEMTNNLLMVTNPNLIIKLKSNHEIIIVNNASMMQQNNIFTN